MIYAPTMPSANSSLGPEGPAQPQGGGLAGLRRPPISANPIMSGPMPMPTPPRPVQPPLGPSPAEPIQPGTLNEGMGGNSSRFVKPLQNGDTRMGLGGLRGGMVGQ